MVLGVVLLTALLVYLFAPALIITAMQKYAAAAGGFHQQTVRIDGNTYHYMDNGRGNKPVVVMLHGFADRKESWLPFANRLSKDYRIVLPDALGHGDNEQDPSGYYALDKQADFIHAFTRALGLEQFHLVGISMGGGIAGQYAGSYEEDLLSLTFISSAGVSGCAHPSRMDVYMDQFATTEEKKENFPLLPDTYTRATADQFKEFIFYKPIFAPNRLFREYTRHVIEYKDFYLQVLADFVDIKSGAFIDPLDDEIADINVPVLVIWGKQDPLLDVSCAAELIRSLPSEPEVALIDNCGHATIAEQPRATYLPLREFLDSADGELAGLHK